MRAKRRHYGFWISAVSLLGGGVAFLLFVGKPVPVPEAPPQFVPPSVDVITVHPEARAIAVESQGTVRPMREIDLISQVAGRVEAVSPKFQEGAFFSAGEELLRLESADYRYAIARAESKVAAARQGVAEEKGRALQASREWRELGSTQANELFLRKPQLVSAEAALKAAKADLGSAELDLERTSFTAPFNGRVSEKYVDLGQYVTLGKAVAKVYDTDVALVRLPLTDREVALLDLPLNNNGARTPDAGPAVLLRARFANRIWEWQGRIVRTDANIDVNSRAVYAVAEIGQPFSQGEGLERPPLAPGLFVSATIGGKQLPRVTVLPRTALRSDSTVMVVGSEQVVRKQPVHVLHSNAGQVWVQGLILGERVIVRESTLTVAGMAVLVNYVTQPTRDIN